MDVLNVERGILVRINGDGSLAYEHTGLTPVEMLGLLELAKQYAFHDLIRGEEKAQEDEALLSALRKQHGG